MGKIEGSWSGMRKYLEKDVLAECLKGRVRYNCTRFVGMDADHLFELYIDDVLVKRFSLETVNSHFIAREHKEDKKPYGTGEYWDGFWNRLAGTKMQDRTEYTDDEFCDALKEYRNQDISSSIHSENPLVLMFAVLDRRVGKRRLAQIGDSFGSQPEWLQNVLNIRLDAENLTDDKSRLGDI